MKDICINLEIQMDNGRHWVRASVDGITLFQGFSETGFSETLTKSQKELVAAAVNCRSEALKQFAHKFEKASGG